MKVTEKNGEFWLEGTGRVIFRCGSTSIEVWCLSPWPVQGDPNENPEIIIRGEGNRIIYDGPDRPADNGPEGTVIIHAGRSSDSDWDKEEVEE